MSSENFAADPDALSGSGRRLSALEARVDQLARDINSIAVGYPDAAGDGEYRKSFDKSYVPLAAGAQAYMSLLSDAVESLGDATVAVADVFADTESDATTNARRR